MGNENKKGITRRDFIKKVGYSTAALGLASKTPKLLKSAKAAQRDHILVGRILPMTGPVAAFSDSTPWLDDKLVGLINKDGGIYIEEYGKKVPVKIKLMDSQSSGTVSAEVAAKLILNDKIDILYVSCTPETINPAAAQCERYKIPGVASTVPAEMYLGGGPYHWAFGTFVLVSDFMGSFMQMWEHVPTNKIVGILAANEEDAVAFAEGANKNLPGAGYKVIDPGRFPTGNRDFTSIINTYKKENVEVLFGNLAPPDFTTVWRQCFQLGYIPKICTIGRALLFPSAVEAIGKSLGLGTSTECIWHRSYGFKSSIGGYSTMELCDNYEAETERQWTAPMGLNHSGYEVLFDALKRAKTLDREKLRNALAATDLDTIAGHAKMQKNNTAITPSGGIQWVKGTKFPFEQVLVSNGNYPELPVDTKLKSVRAFHS